MKYPMSIQTITEAGESWDEGLDYGLLNCTALAMAVHERA